MVKFLTTNGISDALDKLIRDAKDEITLISPYLQVSQRLQESISDANDRGVTFTLIYREPKTKPQEEPWTKSLARKDLCSLQSLHAKCYLNESVAIITSMNLYEFSQQNNYEMGILVDKQLEPELYDAIAEESRYLRRRASPPPTDQSKPSLQPTATKTSGHCIRCGGSIDSDPNKPLCYGCYQEWAKYGNRDYSENYCHNCGKPNATSMSRPLCKPCFRQHQNSRGANKQTA